MVALLLVALIEIVGESVAVYVIGRILLPEVGLTAPGFWVWFWAVVILNVIVLGREVVQGWFS